MYETGIASEDLIPSVRLAPAAPNPFTSLTTISFTLPATGYARLQVFDLSGRLVATLNDSVLPEGPHSFNLSGYDLNAGIYIYRLQHHSELLTGRCVLLR